MKTHFTNSAIQMSIIALLFVAGLAHATEPTVDPAFKPPIAIESPEAGAAAKSTLLGSVLFPKEKATPQGPENAPGNATTANDSPPIPPAAAIQQNGTPPLVASESLMPPPMELPPAVPADKNVTLGVSRIDGVQIQLNSTGNNTAEGRFLHLLSHAVRGFKRCSKAQDGQVELEVPRHEIYAFNTLFRLGIASVCPRAFVVDPQETLTRFFDIRPMALDNETAVGSSGAQGSCLSGGSSIADGLGVEFSSWQKFMAEAKESFERSVLIKADEGKLQEAVETVLKENPELRERLTDVAHTVMGQRGCTGEQQGSGEASGEQLELDGMPRNHTKY